MKEEEKGDGQGKNRSSSNATSFQGDKPSEVD
jgi:hypothetical protein